MKSADLYYLAPELVVLGTALLVLIVDLFLKEEKKRFLAHISIGGLLIAAVLSFSFFKVRASILGNMFILDSFGLILKILILFSSILAIFLALDFLNHPGSKQGEYYSLLLFSTLGMIIITGASNLITIFVGIQLISVPLYVLAGFEKFDPKSNEAALKYFLLGILTAAVTLYGLSLVYGLTGTLNLVEIGENLLQGGISDPVFYLGMTFVIVGLTFKIAAVPFHFWAPDTYEGAPTPVSAFIAAVPKVAGFAALVRLIFTAFPNFAPEWVGLFSLISVLTMFTGNLLAIPQQNIKRMLAFSGIAHVGYILIALAVGNKHALEGIVFYLISYATMNLGTFAVVIGVEKINPENSIPGYAGLYERAPLIALTMTVFLISLVGFPTTSGFISKFLIFEAAIEKGYAWLAIIGVINTVISLYYYINVARYMYFFPAKEKGSLRVGGYVWVTIILSLLAVLVMGLFPEPFIRLARSLTLMFVNL